MTNSPLLFSSSVTHASPHHCSFFAWGSVASVLIEPQAKKEQ
jgi:hypothetical protein